MYVGFRLQSMSTENEVDGSAIWSCHSSFINGVLLSGIL